MAWSKYDWKLIEREYRTNMYSDAELSRRHGCSRTAIQKKAKKLKWTRDLSSAVRQATNAKLVQEDAKVAGKVAGCNAVPDSETIDRASDTAVEVVKCQRRDINNLRDLEAKLIEELGGEPNKLYITQHKGLIVEKVVAIPVTERAAALNNLANVQHKRIQLERQAFGIKDDDTGKKANPLEEIIDSIDGLSKGLPGGVDKK